MLHLRTDLELIFGPLPKNGVTGVTHVTVTEVTPQNHYRYASYVGYAFERKAYKWENKLDVTRNRLSEDSNRGNDGDSDIYNHVDTEREAIAIAFGDVPVRYASAFADLQMKRPEGLSTNDWYRAMDDAGLFLDRWGSRAVRLGWVAHDLFDRAEHGCQGLIWELKGRAVINLTERSAEIDEDAFTHTSLFAKPTKGDRP